MRGVDILLMVNTGTDAVPVWTAVGGQRNATLTEESETIDITSKDSNGAFEYDYGFYGWNIDGDGVYVKNDVGFQELKDAIRNKQKIKVRIQEEGTDVEEGMALVISREFEGAYDAEVTYSVSLQGTGELTTPTA
jgi:TP901-1 family phage major tail protein